MFDIHHEPSHHLVDKVQFMVDDGVLWYLEPPKCTSGSHEVQNDKEAMQVKFDSSGSLWVTKDAYNEWLWVMVQLFIVDDTGSYNVPPRQVALWLGLLLLMVDVSMLIYV